MKNFQPHVKGPQRSLSKRSPRSSTVESPATRPGHPSGQCCRPGAGPRNRSGDHLMIPARHPHDICLHENRDRHEISSPPPPTLRRRGEDCTPRNFRTGSTSTWSRAPRPRQRSASGRDLRPQYRLLDTEHSSPLSELACRSPTCGVSFESRKPAQQAGCDQWGAITDPRMVRADRAEESEYRTIRLPRPDVRRGTASSRIRCWGCIPASLFPG